MPRRVPPGERRDRQVLLRLTDEQADWLEAAAFLERATINEYVVQLLGTHVVALQQSEPVQTVHDQRAAYDAASAQVTPMAQRASTSASARDNSS